LISATVSAQEGAPSGPPPTPVRVANATEESLAPRKRVFGELRASKRSTVAAEEGGIVREVLVREGELAQEGAVLVRLDDARVKLEIAANAAALDAAQAMFEAVRRLNVQRAARGEPTLAMRVGIESGEALVGDLGSSARSVYTAVGSCINLASRLQELARDIGETVVVGPQARAQMVTPLLPLGVHQPRGTPLELEVYGLPRAAAAR